MACLAEELLVNQFNKFARHTADRKAEALVGTNRIIPFTDVANFFTMRRSDGGYIPVGTFPPKQLVENILAQEEWDLPPLAGIARSPILHADGSICTKAGYDSISGLKYCPDPSLNLKPIPEFPCGEEVRASVDILLKVIEDFPFVDQASRANTLAILFSVLMRPVMNTSNGDAANLIVANKDIGKMAIAATNAIS